MFLLLCHLAVPPVARECVLMSSLYIFYISIADILNFPLALSRIIITLPCIEVFVYDPVFSTVLQIPAGLGKQKRKPDLRF